MARPSTPILSRERITNAAFKLVDENGASGFTLSALARILGVSAGSLYSHIKGKDEIVDLMREATAESIDLTVFSEVDWPEALADWARQSRAAFAAHPHAVEMWMRTPIEGPHKARMYETIVASLVGQGWRSGDALSAVIAVENFAMGSALDLVTPETMIDLHDTTDLPYMVAAIKERAQHGRRPEVVFESGLQALIAGMQQARNSATRHKTPTESPPDAPRAPHQAIAPKPATRGQRGATAYHDRGVDDGT